MPVWHLTVKLTDLTDQYRKGELGVEELAEKVAERIKQSGWRDITPYPHTFDDTVSLLRGVDSESEYVAVFNELYDLADSDRVWIETA